MGVSLDFLELRNMIKMRQVRRGAKLATAVMLCVSLEACTTSSDNAVEETTEIMPEDEVMAADSFKGEESDEISGKKEDTDFAISENYKSFDPSGILIHFEFDQSDLNPRAVAALDKIVAGLKADPLAKMVIRGHADKQGTVEYNNQLSERRTKTIRDYLMGKGIAEERLVSVPMGEMEPLIEGDTVKAFKQNRRGDFNLDYTHNVFSSQ